MKTIPSRIALFVLALSPLALPAAPARACSCASCSALSEQEWGGLAGTLGASSGFHADLRYDFVRQDQLRHGTHAASAATVDDALTSGSLEEVETRTTTETTTLGLDYAAEEAWGVNLQIPWIVRGHGTIDGDTLGLGSFDESGSRAGGLGDIKITGRYLGLFEDRQTGVLLGLKLPSGRTDQNFSSGPLAGEALDRSLQLGTGSTDLILGAFHSGELAQNWQWFVQGSWQTALATKDDFRPGDAFELNGGVRFTEFKTVVPHLQVNVGHVLHDRGAQGDAANTGATSVLISPGVTVAITDTLKVYALVQLPVWQDVRGIQLTSSWNASVGISVGF